MGGYIKLDLREIRINRVNWVWLAQLLGPVAGFCEHGNEPLGSVKNADYCLKS
jgi:hypothetical protein